MAILLTGLYASSLKGAEELASKGLQGIIFPLQKKVFLQSSVAEMKAADWTIFTSPGAVRFFVENCSDIRLAKIAAVGESTAKVLEENGLACDLYPKEEYSRKALIKALLELENFAQLSFLIPCSALAPDEIPDALSRLGAKVQRVDLYDLIPQEKRILPVFEQIAFFSSSGVTTFIELYGKKALADKIIGAMGSSTRKTLAESGFSNCLSPEKNTIEAFMEVF